MPWHSDIREAIALLPPEGMTWLLTRAFRACLRRVEACRQPIREVLERRRSIRDSADANDKLSFAVAAMSCATASLALRQDASLGSPSAKESKTADHWTKPLRDIQQPAMARAPLDSVISSRHDSSIEHAFVFTGKLTSSGCRGGMMQGRRRTVSEFRIRRRTDERALRTSRNSDSDDSTRPINTPSLRGGEKDEAPAQIAQGLCNIPNDF